MDRDMFEPEWAICSPTDSILRLKTLRWIHSMPIEKPDLSNTKVCVCVSSRPSVPISGPLAPLFSVFPIFLMLGRPHC